MSPGPGRVFQKPRTAIQKGQKQIDDMWKGNEELAKKRLAVCHVCTSWDKHFKRCKKCGCFTSAKARIPRAQCPLNKWPV